MAGKRDCYEVLGVSRESTVEEIEVAYRKLARKHHPDRNIGDDQATVRFKEVTEAHEILVNSEKRARYDRYGHAGLEGGEGFGPATGGFGDIVSDLFSAFMGGNPGASNRKRGGPRRGADRRVVLDLTLADVVTECKKTLQVRRQETCTTCKGSGSKTGRRITCPQCTGRGETVQRQGFFELRQACARCQGDGTVVADPCDACGGSGTTEATASIEVKVPAGAETGLRLMLGGEGDAGQAGASRGDLEVVVRLAEHSFFKREGTTLACEVPITFSQAALGATIEVPTLTGKVSLTIPKGTQTGTDFRVRGQGMPELRVDRRGQAVASEKRGELIVIVDVETPHHLTKRQEELFRELAEMEHKQVSPRRKSFLERIFGGDDA